MEVPLKIPDLLFFKSVESVSSIISVWQATVALDKM